MFSNVKLFIRGTFGAFCPLWPTIDTGSGIKGTIRYPIQCSLVSCIIGNRLQWNINQNTITFLEIPPVKCVHCFRAQCVKCHCGIPPLATRIKCSRYYEWWRHQMEVFSALLAICAGNSPVPGEFPAQRPVTRSFHVFLDLRLNKPLIKQSWGWRLEMLLHPLWRHCNGYRLDTFCCAFLFYCIAALGESMWIFTYIFRSVWLTQYCLSIITWLRGFLARNCSACPWRWDV